MKIRGFTLVEMVIVIVLVGVLAAVVIPSFFQRLTFDTRGFADQTRSMLQYAQKVAIAQHLNVFVSLSAGNVALCYDAACAATVTNPADQAAYSKAAPSGVILSTSPATVVFNFDALGRSSLPAQLDVQINGDVTRHIYVERETGYVH